MTAIDACADFGLSANIHHHAQRSHSVQGIPCNKERIRSSNHPHLKLLVQSYVMYITLLRRILRCTGILTGSLSSRCSFGLGRPREETPLLLDDTPSYRRPRKYREQPSVPFTLVAPDMLGQYLHTFKPLSHLPVQTCTHALMLLFIASFIIQLLCVSMKQAQKRFVLLAQRSDSWVFVLEHESYALVTDLPLPLT